jgi:perosamine synthetase
VEKLAIEGGRPVRETLLPYGHQWLDDDDIAAVVDVLKGDWLTQGPIIEEFERLVAEYCGARYAVAVCNGTAALHAACAVAGVTAGDEVIVSPVTFAATANAVVYCGGKPVFADVADDNVNIDPAEILKKCSLKTRAIIPVDFAGHPADLDSIRDIARRKGLIVIEDACHALGAEYRGRKVGSLSDMTVFSFHPVKHITTGEGGMVLTDDIEFYERLKMFRHHGIVKDEPDKGSWHYNIYQPGYNFRITDMQCALGVSQFRKLDSFIQRRREIATLYNEVFCSMEEVITPTERPDVKAAYHIYVIRLKPGMLSAGRKEIFTALRAENIGVNVHYMPLHLHRYYQREFGYREGDYPRAERYYEQAITLPIFPLMSDEDVSDVIKAVKKVVYYYSRRLVGLPG